MLAAMPPTPPPTPEPGEARIRDRGDACPGALRLHPADDGRLARLRLPAGRLTGRQAEVLARAAETLGDGRISITSRGNAELRGLGEDCGAELAELLAGAGLLPSPTHERVRNIVASPGAGLDGLGGADVQLWARELDAALCAEPRAASLSGRFLFLLDDGRGDVAGLGGDVSLIAGQDGSVLLRLGSRAFRLTADDAVRAALAAALAFLDATEAAGNGAWRPHELPDEHVPDWAGALARAGITAEPVPVPPLPVSRPPAPGPLGERALHVLAPLGRLTAAQLRALADGAGELRLTPWRGVVAVGAADAGAATTGADTGPGATTTGADTGPGRLADLASHGLITRPDAPGAGVTACTGRPGCAKSLADVRADALAAPPGPLPVHFSGCARRCGHPYGAWIGVLATGDDSYLVDGVPTPRTSLTAAVAAARG
ncbi:cobalamin biosynthesis protein CobG [Streptomyces globisporus]|uniref:cobalamin biosynthesis protein CobG n=1 Tax=Streptomyces globisporus TaxID=1908 RepID=UPI0004C483C7|nr:cobalamin biosynthesis protein CobG [Streptomyces globisporus]